MKRHDRRHGRQTVYPGPAQQLQQHGLGLIVGLVGGEQNLAWPNMPRECRVTRAARGGFQPLSAGLRDLRPLHRAGNVQTFAGQLRLPGPIRRMYMQPVIHVQRVQPQRLRLAQLAKPMQKHAGIEAAAEGDF